MGLHAYLAGWGWWMQALSVPCDQKFSCKWNLSFFKVVPPNRLPFYLGSPFHIIKSLFNRFYLFQNAILHKILKLRCWHFNHFSWNAVFIGCNIFFCFVICLSWYLHIKLSHELLTFISFNIWRQECMSIRSSHLALVTRHFGSQLVFPNIYKATKWLVWT